MNHVNKFVPLTKIAKKNEILEKMKFQSSLSKALRKSKQITARGFSSVFGRSIKSRFIERVCNVVLFMIAPIIASKTFACKF